MSKVYFIKDVHSNKYEEVLEQELKDKFKKGMTVAVKLHMGEGKGMFSPELAKRAVSVLNKFGCKPFLFDTPVAYPGVRESKKAYEKAAAKHGFTKEKIGCPVIISDDYVVVKTKHMNVEVSKELLEADACLVLTHFKGHPASGMGGAIKNIAMGCVSIKSKQDQHNTAMPFNILDDCTACGVCKEICPGNAITIEKKAKINPESCWGCSSCYYDCPVNAFEIKTTFDALMAEATSAALSFFKNKPVYYVNDVRDITKLCDCFSNPGEIIAKDVGVLMSKDIVAIEKASVDLVKKQEGKEVFQKAHHHDPYLHIKEAEKMGLGEGEYELI
ncbi:DUF362 domain-containing protein [Candidatus Woesearchaeota archaeon]|nr:DUF362 domain-containing protein [Candidatus Woesearchaeota archaeon]